ncbi:hypothetical protein DY000_02052126 [Brassica cretica]|uniref:Uncharacterized protein n=1 Tax=Brassica cretica TaxID=69181 RepID=A0ABQ7AJ69_BRACR|nr:hypothetical protein DY000_02052126 [Brassica cretica]
MHGLMSYRRFGRARSLRSDRASAPSSCLSSVAMQRPSGTRVRLLCSDPFRALVR